ncbi:cytochrome [Sesamum angolense]|uniref:Cytochrome n=1 Tax=Sesamum angolense TaxID=2727404 RepID=A0AAE2C7U4_9LAMI|nr:cytochrome [Sesamum angolense]
MVCQQDSSPSLLFYYGAFNISDGCVEKTPLNHLHLPLFYPLRRNGGSSTVCPLYVFSLGKMQVLYVNNPDMVKEITTWTTLDLGRPSYQKKVLWPLLRKEILPSNGSIWARHRKVIAPELFMDKVKDYLTGRSYPRN